MGNKINAEKPSSQWQLGRVEDSPGRNRNLISTPVALHEFSRFKSTIAIMPTFRTFKTIGPSPFKKSLVALLF